MRPLHLAALAAMMAASSRTHAQEPPSAPEATPGEPIELTVRASRTPDTRSSTRAASTVTAAEVKDAHATNLADALRGRAGTSVQQTTPGQSTILVRGFSGRALVHLVDGVRVNSAIFRAGNNPYLGLIDPLGADQIEVIRGASAVLHGSDALAGVVSMSTPLPGYSTAGATTTRLAAYESLTSNPLGTTTRASVDHKAESFAFHVGFTATRFGDIRPGGGIESPVPSSYAGLTRQPGEPYSPQTSGLQRGTAYDALAAESSVRRRIDARTEIVLRAQAAVQPELSRYDDITPRFKRDAPAQVESVLAPLARTMTSATLVRRGGGWLDKALVTASWQRLSEDARSRELVEKDGVRLVASGTRKEEWSRSDAIALRGEAHLLGDDRRRGAVVGAELIHDMVSSGATGAAERFPSGSSMTQAGVFAQLEAELFPGLRAHVGGRGGYFRTDIAARTGAGPTPVFGFAAADGVANAGARWEVASGLAVVANAGRGMRAPNVADFAGLGARAGGRFQVPNPGLGPEHSLSADVGLKLDRGGVRAESFVFALRYDEAIVLAPTTVDGKSKSPDGARYMRSENASSVDVIGTEGELLVPLPARTGAYARWLALLGTQKNDPRTGAPATTPADRMPPAQATLGAWFDATPELRIEAFVMGRAHQTRLNDPVNLTDNRIPEGGTPGFVTVHARATYRASQRATLRVSLDNLGDARVLEHGSGFYRPGFSATAGLEIRTSL